MGIHHTIFVNFSKSLRFSKWVVNKTPPWMSAGLSESHPKLEYEKKKLVTLHWRNLADTTFNWVIKVNTTSEKSCGYHVPTSFRW